MEDIEHQIKELEKKRVSLLKEQEEYLRQPITRGEVRQMLSELKSELIKTLGYGCEYITPCPPETADKNYSRLNSIRTRDELNDAETLAQKLAKIIAERSDKL